MAEVYNLAMRNGILERDEQGRIVYVSQWLPPIPVTEELLKDMAAIGNPFARSFVAEMDDATNQST